MLYRDMTTLLSVAALTDSELLAQVMAFAQRERHVTADLIATLAEIDMRRLYLAAGYSSLFTYCTRVLHLSEHAAYGRIEAARAVRRFPCRAHNAYEAQLYFGPPMVREAAAPFYT